MPIILLNLTFVFLFVSFTLFFLFLFKYILCRTYFNVNFNRNEYIARVHRICIKSTFYIPRWQKNVMRCWKHYHRHLQRQSIFLLHWNKIQKYTHTANMYKNATSFCSKIWTYPCSFDSINFKVIWVGQQLLLLL